MLTTLTIDNRSYKGLFGKIYSAVLWDSLKVQVHKEPIEIRHLRYISRRKKINWKKISKYTREGRRGILYSGKLPVPDDAGIKLFEPIELRQRLCGNMALSVLELMKEVPKKLRVGLYDPEGDFSDLPEHFLKFTDNVIVVTKNYKVYSQQADRLLFEQGAVLSVSPHTSLLSTCNLIVSPSMLETSFTPMTKAVVLTCHKPSVPLACRVYYKYSFCLDEQLEQLKPEGLDTETFAGGLYSLCGMYSLGSLIPLVCTGDVDTQTALSLRRYLVCSINT